MRSTLALATTVLTLLAGPSVCEAAASPGQKHFSVTYQIDPAHDGAINFAKGFGTPPNQLWRVTLSGYMYAKTLIAEGKVFALYEGDGGSEIYALDLSNGQILWQLPFGSQIQSAYDGGVLYVMGATGQLQAFNAGTGEPIWSQQLPAAGLAPPMAVDGRLYLDLPGALYAFDGATGGLLWTQPVVTNGDFSSPTVAGKGVYLASPCQIYRFNAETGKPRWHLDEGSQHTGGQTAAYFRKRLYVQDSQCGNAILDATTGKKTGTFSASYIPALFEDDQGTGYGVSVNSGTLTGFSPDSGNTLWTFSGDPIVTPPVVINSVAFVGSSFGKVYAVDGKTGAQLWSAPATGDIAALTAGEDRLVVTSGDNVNSAVTVYGPQQQNAHR